MSEQQAQQAQAKKESPADVITGALDADSRAFQEAVDQQKAEPARPLFKAPPADSPDAEHRAYNGFEHILQFFRYEHLPPRLQDVSRPFAELAHNVIMRRPRNPERTVALRKLLESKDAAVRAELAE